MANQDEWRSRREENGQGTGDSECDNQSLLQNVHRGIDLGKISVELHEVGAEFLGRILCPLLEVFDELGEIAFEGFEPFFHVFRLFFDIVCFLKSKRNEVRIYSSHEITLTLMNSLIFSFRLSTVSVLSAQKATMTLSKSIGNDDSHSTDK